MTACCPGSCGDAFNPLTRCTDLTPAECSARGGSWFEAHLITGVNFAPCASSPANLCERIPCCERGIAHWPPLPTVGGFDNMGSFCSIRTAESCNSSFPDGFSVPVQGLMGGRSCYVPRTCSGSGGSVGGCQCNVGEFPCRGGDADADFALTFRPIHHRPDDLVGGDDAELVSKNPRKAIDTGRDLEDCKYVYAALGFVRGAPGGDAVMGVTCGKIMGEAFQVFLQPAVFRENGDVRWTGTHRERH